MLLLYLIDNIANQALIIHWGQLLMLRLERRPMLRLIKPDRLTLFNLSLCSPHIYSRMNIVSTIAVLNNLTLTTRTRI